MQTCILAILLLLPGEPQQPVLTLALAGDVMLGRGVAEALDGAWSEALAEVTPVLSGADLAFANLESPLTTAPQRASGHDLRARPEAVVALQSAGFDVLSLANNHALDAGPEGLRQTRAVLAEADIRALAEGEAACTPDWCVLAFYESLGDPEVLIRTVAAADAPGRLLIVSLHWGGEYQAAPSAGQQALAADLAAAGADLIVGHGPHVLQRVEWVGDTLVAYSLGNLLFDQLYPLDCRRAAILLVYARAGRVIAVETIPIETTHGHVDLQSLNH